MYTTTFITLTLATLGLAAPAVVEKRVAGSITLYADPNYGGASTTISFDTASIPNGNCFPIPSSLDNQASSVKLSAEHAGFNCRLYDGAGCDATGGSTWFFDVNIPDLSAEDYNLDNRASSVFCGPSSGST